MKGYYLKQIFQVGIQQAYRVPSSIFFMHYYNRQLILSVQPRWQVTRQQIIFWDFLYVSINSVILGMYRFYKSKFLVLEKYKRMDTYCRLHDFIGGNSTCIRMRGVFFRSGNITDLYREAGRDQCGVEILSITTVPYFLCGIMDLFPGALRGRIFRSSHGVVYYRNCRNACSVDFAFFTAQITVFLFISYPASWIATIMCRWYVTIL